MAKRKPLDKYPKEYFLLMERAAKERIKVACDNETAAQTLRNDLYTFRRVLYQSEQYQITSALAQNVRMCIDDNIFIAEPIRALKGE